MGPLVSWLKTRRKEMHMRAARYVSSAMRTGRFCRSHRLEHVFSRLNVPKQFCRNAILLLALSPHVVWAQGGELESEQDVASSSENQPASAESQASSDAPTLVPPRLIASVDAVYPAESVASAEEAFVELFVNVQTDGSVGEVQVSRSAGLLFDEAARTAVAKWRFEPARRGEQAIASRIRVPFRFVVPSASSVGTTSNQQEKSIAGEKSAVDGPKNISSDEENGIVETAAKPERSEQAPAEKSADDVPIEVTVAGARELRTEARSASDFRIERDVLDAAPRQEGAEVLRSAPGVYIGRAEGPAVAHNYMLRGFDADHGQDIEFRVGGLPINMPSHLHGQGYSDLGFLIADTVNELNVTEGVYDPRQGDFAVAGSIDVQLGVSSSKRGVRFRSGYGTWNQFRQTALWAPEELGEESFGAAQYMRSDGFGENRAGESGSGIFQYRFGEGNLSFRALGILHAARSDVAGVLRKDDVDSGDICFLCVYPYPTARAQNAMSNRFLVGLFADHQSSDGANGQFGFWLGYDNFRLQENHTGFIQQSRVLERVAGRGDLFEIQNQTQSLGVTSRYRTAPYRLFPGTRGTLEMGADARLDIIAQTQNLIDASVRSQTWDRRVDASVRGMDLGLWGDLDWTVVEMIRLRLGARADVLSFGIDDRLGNFAPLSRPQGSFIPGFRRSAQGLAAGPRTSVEFLPTEWMSIQGAYGEGYRSPQARLLEDGEKAPFSKVRSADLGLRLDFGAPLQLSLGGYFTHLSDDIAFDAAEGRLERIGATQRLGAVAHAVTRPFSWLVGSLSMTYVDATLLEAPPASADEPQPPFAEGQNLPFVPPWVIRADLGARRTLLDDFFSRPLQGNGGLGFSYLSPRPLPYGEFSNPVALLDASMGLAWGPMELSFEIFNLLNAQYAAIEYSFPSDWSPNDSVRSRTPARHSAAGAPLSWMLSVEISL